MVDTSVVYNSGILVLLFIGFLALIVTVQLIPAIVTLMGMIKATLADGKASLTDGKATLAEDKAQS